MEKTLEVAWKTVALLVIFGSVFYITLIVRGILGLDTIDIGIETQTVVGVFILAIWGLAGWCREDIYNLWSNTNFRGNIYNWWNKKKNIESSKHEQLEDKLNTILSKLDDVATKEECNKLSKRINKMDTSKR